MVTCPWCGTSYSAFQPNCQKCGGPLSTPVENPIDEMAPAPPLPPRSISDSYTWKLLASDGWGIVALVFTLLGVIFTFLGIALTMGVVTAFVGIPFAIMGLCFLGGGLFIGVWRYQIARQAVEVLKNGQAATGQITEVEENHNVTVNGRHPWKISYRFQALGREYGGVVTTLNVPGESLQTGKQAWVLYLPDAPERNTPYPHP